MVKIQNLRLGKSGKTENSDSEKECQCGKCEGELQPEFRGDTTTARWVIVCDNCRTNCGKEVNKDERS